VGKVIARLTLQGRGIMHFAYRDSPNTSSVLAASAGWRARN
jgi:hypothetical protein